MIYFFCIAQAYEAFAHHSFSQRPPFKNIMSVSQIAEWAAGAGAAFLANERSESLLLKTGEGLRSLFSCAADAVAHPSLRDAFKSAYIEQGGNEKNVPSYWSRVLYQYAFPGEGKTSGKYYMRTDDGTVRLDTARNTAPSPPPEALLQKKAPVYLKRLPLVGVEAIAELAGFPMRMVVAARSGGGKTTYVRQLIGFMQEQGIVNYTLIVTGTRADHWHGLQEETEVLEFDESSYARVAEIVETQKSIVRSSPQSEWGRPLVVFDDLGDQSSARQGEGGKLLDSFFMTLRNFNISVIAINQQQNNFLTPARRDGATCVLVGDLTNKQREGVYDTLGIPPAKLKKQEFVSFCDDFLGTRHHYTFLAYCKEQQNPLYLTRSGDAPTATAGVAEELSSGMRALSFDDAASSGAGGVYRDDDDNDDPVSVGAAGGSSASEHTPFKGDRRRLQGGSNQKPANDLYTTQRKTITPLLAVLQERHPGAVIWEPCVGTGCISSVLEEAGFRVIGTDLFSYNGDGTQTANPSQSFVSCEMNGESYDECAVPEGVQVIVTNPPFSLKASFIERIYRLGLPTYCVLPIESLGTRRDNKIFADGGMELFILPGGTAASDFFKVSENRMVSVGTCSWFAFNTRHGAGERNAIYFLDDE